MIISANENKKTSDFDPRVSCQIHAVCIIGLGKTTAIKFSQLFLSLNYKQAEKKFKELQEYTNKIEKKLEKLKKFD
jgi:hypothetical protein